MHPQIVAALRRLQKERRTGVFRTTAEQLQREVRLESGAIVGARSSSLDDRLGEVMVRRGGITRQQLVTARRTSPSGNELKRLLDQTTVPILTPEAYAVLESLSLRSQEALVLSRCDGQSDVRGIFAQSPLSEQDTARILLGLEYAGIIEMKNLSTAGY